MICLREQRSLANSILDYKRASSISGKSSLAHLVILCRNMALQFRSLIA